MEDKKTLEEMLEASLRESMEEFSESLDEEYDESTSPDIEKQTDIPPDVESEGNSAPDVESDGNMLNQIIDSMNELNEKFDQKIAVDEHKNQLFDNMHAELTDYRNGVADKPVEQIAMDIIQMNDALKNSIERYGQEEPTEENYQKLLKILAGVIEDQDDLLYRQGIEAYSVEGTEVDVRRQKTIGSVETEDESLHNTVSERIACGYEKDDKVIRPERVKIFKYVSNKEA